MSLRKVLCELNHQGLKKVVKTSEQEMSTP